jgi:hypothetical protein
MENYERLFDVLKPFKGLDSRERESFKTGVGSYIDRRAKKEARGDAQ